jgi:hypothetical protein
MCVSKVRMRKDPRHAINDNVEYTIIKICRVASFHEAKQNIMASR